VRIAFAVSDSYFRTLTTIRSPRDEASLLREGFAAMDIAFELVDWRDPAVDWTRFDVVLPKGCWNYFEHVADFQAWMDRLGRDGVRLINPREVVRWNLAKPYLLELAAAGIPVAPLLYFTPGSQPDLDPVLAARGWAQVVLKPAISAGAWKTLRTSAPLGDEARALAAELLGGSGLIVQPFFEEIVREGEWSLLFFGGEFSHAVLKTPRADDFRSQPTWGAAATPVDPPAAMLEQAEAVLRAAPGRLTYARVDGFRRDGVLHLMELEVIEPYLFFDAAGDEAPRRFCEAVAAAARDGASAVPDRAS